MPNQPEEPEEPKKPKKTGVLSTSEFNSISKAREELLTEMVKSSMMGVLSALYEGQVVKRVNLGAVMALYGLTDPKFEKIWVEFSGAEFQRYYKEFKNNPAQQSSIGDPKNPRTWS